MESDDEDNIRTEGESTVPSSQFNSVPASARDDLSHYSESQNDYFPIIPINPSISDRTIHPIQALQEKASAMCRISTERAFAVDDINLSRGLGEYALTALAERFYRRVYHDTNNWFRPLFKSPIQDAVDNLGEFLLQRFGGPTYYTDRKGRPNLIAIHQHIPINPRIARHWLNYMQQALDETEIEEIPLKQKEIIIDFLTHQAFFLVAANETREDNTKYGTQDDYEEDDIL